MPMREKSIKTVNELTHDINTGCEIVNIIY